MAEQGLEAVAFPKLTEEQIEQLGRYAGVTPKKFRAEEALFRVGDRDFRFFVVKSGEVEIIDETGDKPKVIAMLPALQPPAAQPQGIRDAQM